MNKKIFISVLFTFLFCLLFFCKPSFCATVDYDGISYTIPDDVTGYVLCVTYGSNNRVLIYNTDNTDLKVYDKNNNFFTIDNGGNTFYIREGNSTTTDFTRINASSRTGNLSVKNTPIYGTVNIMNRDGSVFFQKPPVMNPEVPEITLEEIMNKAGEQATMEVGQIILMVMKVTAGLIACVIGFKAGWKFFTDGWWC